MLFFWPAAGVMLNHDGSICCLALGDGIGKDGTGKQEEQQKEETHSPWSMMTSRNSSRCLAAAPACRAQSARTWASAYSGRWSESLLQGLF
jgi:hypothetical protein